MSKTKRNSPLKEGDGSMQEILKLNDISLRIMDSMIFEKVNASVHLGDVIGIVGKNGAGKSTLLQVLSGGVQPSSGQCWWLKKNIKIAVVEQEVQYYISSNVNKIEASLLSKWHVPTNEYTKLSGGEKLKARLANGFSQSADVLLLDEPTNHLDEQSTQLLINQIKYYKGTIVLVSHDRFFLDQVATKIWSLENRKLIEHRGNYTSYMKEREQRRLTQQREYEKQQHMVATIEKQMNELTSWSQKAHTQSTKQEGTKEFYRVKAKRMDKQVKSKRKRLEKELEKSKVEQVEPEYKVQFSLKAKQKRGKRFLEVKKLSKAFEGRTLFENVNFIIQKGERIALLGPNGSGKTTLLKIIMGQENAKGDIWISPATNIGYLTQEVFDLPLSQTPEELFYRETFEERGKVQNLMKHLGFEQTSWKEPIGKMSMGERVKCKLMVFILEGKDVLILDEPTNHLDLPSREQLEATLSEYNGTLLVVSHDRYFIDKITDSKLIIENYGVKKLLAHAPKVEKNNDELLLRLETERQEILGKLSFMTNKDEKYEELDLKFKELTKQIVELKK